MEQLERAEDELRRERHGHQAASEALRDQILINQTLQVERQRLQDEAAARAQEYERELASLTRFYRHELETLHAELERTHRLHALECDMWATRVSDLQRQLVGLTWTQAHRDEARQLGLPELFDRMLLAATSTECEGLGELVVKLAGKPSSFLEDWVSNSHWESRLSQHVQQLFGGGTSLDVCIQISRYLSRRSYPPFSH